MKNIDWHCHILPQIDDGAENIKEAGDMLITAKNSGIDTIVCTYHNRPGYWMPSLEEANCAFRSVSKIRDSSQPKLHLICEAHLDTDLPAKAGRKEIALLCEKAFFLELPNLNRQVAMNSVLRFRGLGLLPIICHPERFIEKKRDFGTLEQLKNAGCLVQINAYSLMGEAGREQMKSCQKMISNGIADMLGSDCHRANDGRIEALAAAYKSYPIFAEQNHGLLANVQ